MTEPTTPKKRGLACLPAERRREIAAMGGRAAHRAGTAHQFTSAEAQEAGRKGGSAKSRNGTKARGGN
jgi:uncharacterized protein